MLKADSQYRHGIKFYKTQNKRLTKFLLWLFECSPLSFNMIPDNARSMQRVALVQLTNEELSNQIFLSAIHTSDAYLTFCNCNMI